MKITTLLDGRSIIYSNCYGILSDKAAIVVDPGKYTEDLYNFLQSNSDKERLILITHAHFDHIGGALELREKTGVKIAIGADEAEGLYEPSLNLSARVNRTLVQFHADITFFDKQEYTVGDLTVKVLFTPGHTKGGVCYLIGGALISGDTLFYETVGRTDLPGGSQEKILKSLSMLLNKLPPETVVYPGHGGTTTISHEQLFNPFVR